MDRSDDDELPFGRLLKELIADRKITPATERDRRREWARQWDLEKPGSADTFRNSGTNLNRWKKAGSKKRRPRANSKNESLLLAVLGLESREDLGLAILKLQAKKAGASVAGEVAESVRSYDLRGPMLQLAERLYQQGGFAERLQELEEPERKLVQSYFDEAAARVAEADRSLALLDILLNPRKKD